MKKSFKITALCVLSLALFSSCNALNEEIDFEADRSEKITQLEKEMKRGKRLEMVGNVIVVPSVLGICLYHYIEDKQSWNPVEDAVDVGFSLLWAFGTFVSVYGSGKHEKAAKKLKACKEA